MEDIRDILFEEIASKRFRAVLTAERSGVISGVEEAYAIDGQFVHMGVEKYEKGA